MEIWVGLASTGVGHDADFGEQFTETRLGPARGVGVAEFENAAGESTQTIEDRWQRTLLTLQTGARRALLPAFAIIARLALVAVAALLALAFVAFAPASSDFSALRQVLLRLSWRRRCVAASSRLVSTGLCSASFREPSAFSLLLCSFLHSSLSPPRPRRRRRRRLRLRGSSALSPSLYWSAFSPSCSALDCYCPACPYASVGCCGWLTESGVSTSGSSLTQRFSLFGCRWRQLFCSLVCF